MSMNAESNEREDPKAGRFVAQSQEGRKNSVPSFRFFLIAMPIIGLTPWLALSCGAILGPASALCLAVIGFVLYTRFQTCKKGFLPTPYDFVELAMSLSLVAAIGTSGYRLLRYCFS